MYKYNNTTAIYLVIDTHILVHIFIPLQYYRYFLIVLHSAKYDYPVPPPLISQAKSKARITLFLSYTVKIEILIDCVCYCLNPSWWT